MSFSSNPERKQAITKTQSDRFEQLETTTTAITSSTRIQQRSNPPNDSMLMGALPILMQMFEQLAWQVLGRVSRSSG